MSQALNIILHPLSIDITGLNLRTKRSILIQNVCVCQPKIWNKSMTIDKEEWVFVGELADYLGF